MLAAVILSLVSLALTGAAWGRILRRKNPWPSKLGYLVLTAVPLAGPMFYMIIDPPENGPIATAPEKLWTRTERHGNKVWPSFSPLINFLARLFGDRKG